MVLVVAFCSHLCTRARSWREFAKSRFTHFPSILSVHVDSYGLIISCIIFALIITIDISCTGSRSRFRDDITSNRGCGIDQCPISQTRAVHLQERSYEYCCYSRWPASHWILVHNTFEGMVTNYRRAVD